MILCGIDPMDKGAIAIMDTSEPCSMTITDMPVVNVTGTRPEVDVPALWDFFRENRVDKVYVEKMSPMPKGGNANFKRGGYLYLFRAIFAAAGIPFVEVPPKEWQKRFGIRSKKADDTKDQSYLVASRLFPSHEFKGPKGGIKDGRSDAALIAEHARITETGNGGR